MERAWRGCPVSPLKKNEKEVKEAEILKYSLAQLKCLRRVIRDKDIEFEPKVKMTFWRR